MSTEQTPSLSARLRETSDAMMQGGVLYQNAVQHYGVMREAATALERLEAEVADLNATCEEWERLSSRNVGKIAALEAERARYEERERHFAEALRVADGGVYRADWDGAIARVIRERASLRTALEELRDVVKNDLLPVVHGEAPKEVWIADAFRINGVFQRVDTALSTLDSQEMLR